MDKKIAQFIEKECENATKRKRICSNCKKIDATINSHFAPKKNWLELFNTKMFFRLERIKFYTSNKNRLKFEKRGINEVILTYLNKKSIGKYKALKTILVSKKEHFYSKMLFFSFLH